MQRISILSAVQLKALILLATFLASSAGAAASDVVRHHQDRAGQHDGRQLATNFGARGSPKTVIYDKAGVVIDVTLGGMTAQQLAAKLEQFFGVIP